MSQRILYESELLSETTPNAPVTIAPGTGPSDVVNHAPKIALARNVISESLPAMLGFVQQMNSPEGFIFGYKDRESTSITQVDTPFSEQQPPSDQGNGTPDYNMTVRTPADPMGAADGATSTPIRDEDPVIIRKLVKTDITEVIFDLTNEVSQDIDNLFGSNIPNVVSAFLEKGGEVYGVGDDFYNFQHFFLTHMIAVATTKLNRKFIKWISEKATLKGNAIILTPEDMIIIFTIIGELREALTKSTGKTGEIFALCSPRIASFISTTLGATMDNGSSIYKDRPKQTGTRNGFVLKAGDISFFEIDYSKMYNPPAGFDEVTGGEANTTELVGEILVGFMGSNGPNAASVYFNPYREYLVAGGADYETGQSNFFFRMRTAWSTNPLDTGDKSQITADTYETEDGKSQYLVKCTVTMPASLIL